jgi:hypothetical protein
MTGYAALLRRRVARSTVDLLTPIERATADTDVPEFSRFRAISSLSPSGATHEKQAGIISLRPTAVFNSPLIYPS